MHVEMIRNNQGDMRRHVGRHANANGLVLCLAVHSSLSSRHVEAWKGEETSAYSA